MTGTHTDTDHSQDTDHDDDDPDLTPLRTEFPINRDTAIRPNIYYPERMHGAICDIARTRDVPPEAIYHAALSLIIKLDPTITDYQPQNPLTDTYLNNCSDSQDMKK